MKMPHGARALKQAQSGSSFHVALDAGDNWGEAQAGSDFAADGPKLRTEVQG
jgi:hypothetical protein